MLESIAEREQFRSIYAAKIVNNSNPHKLISRKYTNPHYFYHKNQPIPTNFVFSMVFLFIFVSFYLWNIDPMM